MITKPQSEYIKNPIFISYTSLSDFLKCPRVYFLKNIYRDPKTGNKIQVASPHLSLGSTVHDTVRWYLDMRGQVTKKQLEDKFGNLWLKYKGRRGGFESNEQEADFGERGFKMLDNFFNNAQKLEKTTYHLDFPKLNLFEDVILMGNLDFVGGKADETLHVLDFKTGSQDEKDPLQLYIYAILAEVNLEKPVSSASFWYLDREDKPREIVLDSLEPKLEWLTEKGRQLKRAREEGIWVCKNSEELCRDCRDYQAIIEGKAEFQFTDFRYKKDVYYLDKSA